MKRKHIEDDIQREVVRHLRTRGAPGILYWHTPNGGRREIREAARFKAMGVRPGVSDIIALRNEQVFALELKAPKGRPTEAQLAFQSEFKAAGGYACVAEGLDEAIRILEAWGLLRAAA